MLVCSYNPAYRSSLKELKPSFRQRFATLSMSYLPPEREAEVVVAETGVGLPTAQRLVGCAVAIRTADEAFHFEPPSTRVLVTAAQLISCRRNRIGGGGRVHSRAVEHRRRDQ